MRKYAVALMFSIGLILCGCGSTSQNEMSATQEEKLSDAEPPVDQAEQTSEIGIADNSSENTTSTEISQGGPYGEISLSLPDGWSYELCSADSDKLLSGMYGIKIYPDGVNEGFIEIDYMDSFGVCGVGLAEESATIAGVPANIGTFDNNEHWDFIAFNGEYDGLIALTYFVDDWWSEYSEQVPDILDTLSFDQSVREGGAYIYNSESEIDEIALYFSLKNISSTRATMVFNQYDASAPKGELIYGEAYVIEVLKNGEWEEAPIAVEGDYGFHDIAFMLPCEDVSEREIDWEWLYGELEPGEYRIGKSIDDIIESGNSEKYMVYAYFVLN